MLKLKRFGCVFCSALLIVGCASSNVSHDVEDGVDQGVQNANNLYHATSDGDIANSYQNTNQATKGAIVGGAAGTVTGIVTSMGALPGLAAGVIFGASYGQYLDANMSMRDLLENRGINVMVLGDNVRLSIPSARLFNPYTATVSSSAYSTLQVVAQYINSATTTLITVSAYTDDYAPPRVSLSLSENQAKNVAKLLSAYGVNTRLLYAKGYGGVDLIDESGASWGESDNDRIEITFERMHA